MAPTLVLLVTAARPFGSVGFTTARGFGRDRDGYMAWLLRNGEVLASVEVASSLAARSRGLLGKKSFEGALLLRHTRSVHTIGMRFAIDVAFLTDDLSVVATTTLGRQRIALPRRGGRSVLEAEAGAFARWQLAPGDQLEIKG